MSFNEVKELRKAGQLEDAYELAKKGIELAINKNELFKELSGGSDFGLVGEGDSKVQLISTDELWAKRAMCWVLYDYIKQSVKNYDYHGFIKWLSELNSLQLPSSEIMIFDSLSFQITSFLYQLSKEDKIDYNKVDQIFNSIKFFHFSKPSESYSALFRAFYKFHLDWICFEQFADLWNYDNFQEKDFQETEYNGRKTMSLAEQAYIAYAKKLLASNVDKDKIETFIAKLDILIEKYPAYEYPPYFKAKLLLSLGNDDNALIAFLPFAKQKRNAFWVWGLMAEIFAHDKDIQFACYCKALSLKTPEDFLVKLRQAFAKMLIEKRMYNEAKTEIQKAIVTREKQEWKLPNEIVQWKGQEWYKSAIDKKDNQDFYTIYLKQAEEILFQDISEEIIAVEFVNENKSMLNFVKDKRKFGFFNYSGNLTKPQIGDLLKVRFNGDGQDGFYKILSAYKADSYETSVALKDFEGTIKVISPQNFGFIEDIFIEPKVIAGKKLTDGQLVKGRAILSFNKKKSEWGWKAISINK
jgi:hypothetical protein